MPDLVGREQREFFNKIALAVVAGPALTGAAIGLEHGAWWAALGGTLGLAAGVWYATACRFLR